MRRFILNSCYWGVLRQERMCASVCTQSSTRLRSYTLTRIAGSKATYRLHIHKPKHTPTQTRSLFHLSQYSLPHFLLGLMSDMPRNLRNLHLHLSTYPSIRICPKLGNDWSIILLSGATVAVTDYTRFSVLRHPRR